MKSKLADCRLLECSVVQLGLTWCITELIIVCNIVQAPDDLSLHQLLRLYLVTGVFRIFQGDQATNKVFDTWLISLDVQQ